MIRREYRLAAENAAHDARFSAPDRRAEILAAIRLDNEAALVAAARRLVADVGSWIGAYSGVAQLAIEIGTHRRSFDSLGSVLVAVEGAR